MRDGNDVSVDWLLGRDHRLDCTYEGWKPLYQSFSTSPPHIRLDCTYEGWKRVFVRRKRRTGYGLDCTYEGWKLFIDGEGLTTAEGFGLHL